MNPPRWYTPADASTWERVKEALARDWDQTKHDLSLGGHELNQKFTDTAQQVGGSKAIPPNDVLNPPRVVARWEDAESWIGFGYACRTHYGAEYSGWCSNLESRIRHDWRGEEPWQDVKLYVRHGYEVPR